MVSRFGQLDSTDGGNAQRYSLSAQLRHVASNSVQEVQLYGISSQLNVYSNFSYFLEDPVNGDQFAQRDRRTIVGGAVKHTQSLEMSGASTMFIVGVQSRMDFINGLGLAHTKSRQPLATVRDDHVRENGTGIFVEAESRWTPWFRSVIGLRGDAYVFNVESDNAQNSGRRTAAIASPKASFVFTPSSNTEMYVSGGFGFHSNDARGTTIRVDPSSGEEVARVDPLVRSRGGEVGMRVNPVRDADAGYVLRRGLRLQVSILNVLDSKADDIQYYYASRLQSEAASGMDDVHFHPAEPRQMRVSIGWKF